MSVEFGLLGDLVVRVGDRGINAGHAKQQCVLAALLVDVNRPVSVAQLVDRVWAGQPPLRAREALYSYLSRLRSLLTIAHDVRITRGSNGYLLTVNPLAVDLHRFRQMAVQSRAINDDHQARIAMLTQARDLWRGTAFASLDTPWINAVRDSLERERFAVELDLNDLMLQQGRHSELVTGLVTAAEACPLDERLAGQLMLALYGSGRQADALDFYRDLRLRLADELGINPGAALQRLHQQLLTADPKLKPPESGCW